VSTQTFADETVRDLLAAFAAPVPTPGGGSAAALAAAVAAALVERCARVAPGDGFAHARARAGVLGRELVQLADLDASALASLVAASRSGSPETRGAAAEASGPPARLQVAAAEIGELAASLERDGSKAFRGEAICAMLLANAAASIAGTIVAMNLALAARET
jgi:formiminotetrahydrofolate cyclodeaminase